MTKMSVYLLRGMSSVIDVETDSVDEAMEKATAITDFQPCHQCNDSFEPGGEAEVIVVYNSNGETAYLSVHGMTTLIRGGITIDTDPVQVLAADVLVENGRIAAVGPGLSVPAGAEVFDATGMLVLPGFVDTHRHTWPTALRATAPDTLFAPYVTHLLGTLGPRYRPDDIRAGTLAGALECLDAGITHLRIDAIEMWPGAGPATS